MKRTVLLGLKSLWLRRLRSLLTVLGIVFGVCSVIAMLAIGEGASYEAQEQLRSLGSSNIILRSVKPPEEQNITSVQSRMIEYGLKYDDVRQIRATIPNVKIIVPGRLIRKTIWNRARRIDCDIMGTVPWYPEICNHRIGQGRFFTEIEMEAKANVCVLSETMADTLFPIDRPVGRSVRVGNQYYRVIGVMESKGETSTKLNAGRNGLQLAEGTTQGATERMFIPLSAAQSRFGEVLVKLTSGQQEIDRVELHEVTINVADQKDVVPVSAVIKKILSANHKKLDYEVKVPLELMRRAERTKQIFNIVLGSIAAISLVVGGIGIMNIMLASVTERTREIGTRRALGAKRHDIITQFLAETVILSTAGGLIGVVVGVTIPFLIEMFAGMKTIVTPWSPIIALSFSALVGIVFGVYPAFRAAHMDPVEALRHE